VFSYLTGKLIANLINYPTYIFKSQNPKLLLYFIRYGLYGKFIMTCIFKHCRLRSNNKVIIIVRITNDSIALCWVSAGFQFRDPIRNRQNSLSVGTVSNYTKDNTE
jgi:hypothetical protein